jgi:hypothetical protein
MKGTQAMYSRKPLLFILSTILIGALLPTYAQGFIEREYTIHEILDACTNIVSGKVKSVDNRRLRGIIEVEKDIKGKSNLSEIKMNFATGQYRRETTPQKMVKLLKVGMPIIIFYRQTYAIESLGYVNGTWFQTRAHGGRHSAQSWWSFTHIDPMMSRTFSRPTEDFQEIIRDILSGKKWVGTPKNALKVLVLTGNSTPPMWSQVPVYTNTVTYEYNAIRSVKKTAGRRLAYEATRDRGLPDLDKADILWLGQDEISAGDYRLNKATENKIKRFVKNGGIVIVSGQESDYGQSYKTGWLDGKLEGVERPPTREFHITKKGRTLFTKPNRIRNGQLYFDNAWTRWSKGYEIFATANNGTDLLVGVRKYGKGLYIITSMCNDSRGTDYSRGTVAGNKKLIANLLYYAVKQI